jgi:hypothetical protein
MREVSRGYDRGQYLRSTEKYDETEQSLGGSGSAEAERRTLGTNVPSLSRAKLMQLIEEAVLDAYTEEEQAAEFLTVIEEHLALPFSVKILGVDADAEKVDVCTFSTFKPKNLVLPCLISRCNEKS